MSVQQRRNRKNFESYNSDFKDYRAQLSGRHEEPGIAELLNRAYTLVLQITKGLEDAQNEEDHYNVYLLIREFDLINCDLRLVKN